MPSRRWLRIIPVAVVMYTIAYVDRTNISLALPATRHQLRVDPQQAGSAAGAFFRGYVLLQIPGGYLARRWSAKRLISLLLVLWGVCAVGGGLVQTQRQLSWHSPEGSRPQKTCPNPSELTTFFALD